MKKPRKILIIIIIAALFAVLLSGCGSQYVAKHLGGTTTVDLPAGQKLIHVTWKDDSLWYLTRPMTEAETAEMYSFQESSNLGLLEGTVIIQEHLTEDSQLHSQVD